jgi:hypothetical protein
VVESLAKHLAFELRCAKPVAHPLRLSWDAAAVAGLIEPQYKKRIPRRSWNIAVSSGRINAMRTLDPNSVKSLFYWSQIGLGALFAVYILWFRNRERPSGFRTSEADKKKPIRPTRGTSTPNSDPLAHARIQPKPEPMRLTGIRIDAAAHEILGVSPRATPEEIQRAYRELMKRYHPDLVGRPGSREWVDAQRIAEAINRAKEQMLGSKKR